VQEQGLNQPVVGEGMSKPDLTHIQIQSALFGYMCMQFSPRILEWIGMKLSLIPL